MESTSPTHDSQAGAKIIRLPGACTNPVRQPSLRGRRPRAVTLIRQRREQHQAKVKAITDEIAFHERIIEIQQEKIGALLEMLKGDIRPMTA